MRKRLSIDLIEVAALIILVMVGVLGCQTMRDLQRADIHGTVQAIVKYNHGGAK